MEDKEFLCRVEIIMIGKSKKIVLNYLEEELCDIDCDKFRIDDVEEIEYDKKGRQM